MRRILHRCLTVFLLGAVGLTIFVAPPAVTGQAQDATVRESVEKFCGLEFGGDQDVEQRQELVYFSDARVYELAKVMGGLSPYVFEWETAPLDIVDSYKIGRVIVMGGEATASVTYEVIARRTSWGSRIERTPKKSITVQLQLKLYGDRWKVKDPPFPRVSKKFLLSSYREIFDLPQTWYQNASSQQLMRLRNAIDNILLIDDLK